MAQYGRPDGDISTGSWTTAPLWDDLDEAGASDADYVQRTGGDDTFEVSLSDVTDPVSSSGHVVRVRSCKTGAQSLLGATAKLMQGSTQICSFNIHYSSTTWTTTTYTLSDAEADAITDYSDLRVRVSVDWTSGISTGLRVSWIEFECPDAAAAGGQPMQLRGLGVPGMRQWQPGRRFFAWLQSISRSRAMRPVLRTVIAGSSTS